MYFYGYIADMEIPSETGPEPLVVSDHPALDLLNTVANVEGQAFDFFRTDGDVIRWLVRLGMAPEGSSPKAPRQALLEAARSLRETVRGLVLRRKEGKKADPSGLNAALRAAETHPELVWESPGSPRLQRKRELRTPEQFLAPLAESAAELLSSGDFDLVRPCGNHECSLWFYDRTKSHRRRWCSMAVCGNRHKVAAFRQRQLE